MSNQSQSLHRDFVRITLALVFALLSSACIHERGPDKTLAAKIDPILHQLDDTGAIVSARIVDPTSGRELYATKPDEPVMPASNMKLQTASAGLDRLGPDHVFKTYLAMDGDDLWLVGTGDPACGDSRLEQKYGRKTMSMLDDWSEALKARGISQIKGKLYFYDGAFDSQTISPNWSKGYLTDYYAAPVSGLNFNTNCIDVVAVATEPGQPAKLEVTPPTAGNTIVNQCTSARPNERETVDIKRDPDSNVFTITGKVQKRKELSSKPVIDPGAFFADALRTNLESHGITIAGPTERSRQPLGGSADPPKEKIIATHETKMADVLNRICKNSNNLFADALCKYQGRAMELSRGKDVPGSWANGGESVHAFLQKNKIDDSQFVIVDGSGLARANRVTTRLISDELVVMHRHRYHDAFFTALPIGGKDGTIAKRMPDLQGHVFAKTGFIGGVRSLSGYVKTKDGKWLVFSIIFNKLPGSVAPAEDVQDNVCRVLVEYPKMENAQIKPIRPATTQSSE